MKMRRHLNEILSYGVDRTIDELKALLKARRVWFIEARLWPALRQLEDDGLVQRRVHVVLEGGPRDGVRTYFRKVVHPVEGAAACL